MLASLRLGKKRSVKRRGQTVTEYMIIVGLVVTVFMALSPLFRRGIHSIIRLAADQLANQQNAEQKPSVTSGYLKENYSSTLSAASKETVVRLGDYNYIYDDADNVFTNSIANLGFTVRQ